MKKFLFLFFIICFGINLYAEENKTKTCFICDNKGNILYELSESEIIKFEKLLKQSKKKGLAKVLCRYRIKIIDNDTEIVYKTNGILIAQGNDIYYELEEDVIELFIKKTD